MPDLRFNDVVLDSRSYIDGWRATCTTCSTVKRCEVFEADSLFPMSNEVLRYVAEMRAWNCCHEGQEPLDGFPEEPDAPTRLGSQ